MVRLVSQTDGGVVEITETAAATSSMLSTAIGEEEGVGEVALPASAASIALATKWMARKADAEAELLESAHAESSLFASLVSLPRVGRTPRPSPLLVRHDGEHAGGGRGGAAAAHLAREAASDE